MNQANPPQTDLASWRTRLAALAASATGGDGAHDANHLERVWRNAQAIVELREKHGVEIRDTPKDFFPEFVRATNIVLDRYAQKDAFFKEVLASQRTFAKTVVPYWTKVIDLYSQLGNAALTK